MSVRRTRVRSRLRLEAALRACSDAQLFGAQRFLRGTTLQGEPEDLRLVALVESMIDDEIDRRSDQIAALERLYFLR